MLIFLFFFFFFSSRRRHTRSLRDWSSDVCSSDLTGAADPDPGRLRGGPGPYGHGRLRAYLLRAVRPLVRRLHDHRLRSEERRVGKECRSWWGTSTLKKKENSIRVAASRIQIKDRA